MRSFPLEGASTAFGAALLYRSNRVASIEPALKLTWATRNDVDLSTGYDEFNAASGIGYPWQFGDFVLRATAYGSFEYLSQNNRAGERRHTAGFGYLVSLGAEYRLDQFIVGPDVGAGGRVFNLKIEDVSLVHRFDFQAALTAGWRF